MGGSGVIMFVILTELLGKTAWAAAGELPVYIKTLSYAVWQSMLVLSLLQ